MAQARTPRPAPTTTRRWTRSSAGWTDPPRPCDLAPEPRRHRGERSLRGVLDRRRGRPLLSPVVRLESLVLESLRSGRRSLQATRGRVRSARFGSLALVLAVGLGSAAILGCAKVPLVGGKG